MPDRPAPPQAPPTEKQICLYISEMCGELENLARTPRLRTIRYLLNMARREAEHTGKGLRD